jgi:hypothetical protein
VQQHATSKTSTARASVGPVKLFGLTDRLCGIDLVVLTMRICDASSTNWRSDFLGMGIASLEIVFAARATTTIRRRSIGSTVKKSFKSVDARRNGREAALVAP